MGLTRLLILPLNVLIFSLSNRSFYVLNCYWSFHRFTQAYFIGNVDYRTLNSVCDAPQVLFSFVFFSTVERTNWYYLILHTTDLDDLTFPVMQQVSLFILDVAFYL